MHYPAIELDDNDQSEKPVIRRASEIGFAEKLWNDPTALNHYAKTALWLLCVILMFAGLWWGITRPFFSFRQITVEGADGKPVRYVSGPTIKGSALPHLRGNFFTADLNHAREAFESVAWVAHAGVRREWPSKLIVTVEEHVPLGTWGDQGKLLSDQGVVFVANLAEAEESGEMLQFSGPDGTEKAVVKRYDELRQWFAPLKLFPISVSLSARESWTVKLHTGLTIELGRDLPNETVKDRIDRLASVYPQLQSRLNAKLEYVDLRYPNGFAIRADGLNPLPEKKKS